jgi:hypothetical protein
MWTFKKEKFPVEVRKILMAIYDNEVLVDKMMVNVTQVNVEIIENR